MAAENLADVISSLTPEEQESVKQFIDSRSEKDRRHHHRFSPRLTSSSTSTPNCSAVWPSDVLPNR